MSNMTIDVTSPVPVKVSEIPKVDEIGKVPNCSSIAPQNQKVAIFHSRWGRMTVIVEAYFPNGWLQVTLSATPEDIKGITHVVLNPDHIIAMFAA
jgi:hypothetical protein